MTVTIVIVVIIALVLGLSVAWWTGWLSSTLKTLGVQKTQNIYDLSADYLCNYKTGYTEFSFVWKGQPTTLDTLATTLETCYENTTVTVTRAGADCPADRAGFTAFILCKTTDCAAELQLSDGNAYIVKATKADGPLPDACIWVEKTQVVG